MQLSSSSKSVRVPAAAAARAHQTRLTFQASVDRIARQETVTLTATLGETTLQDTVQVLPSLKPVLTVPGKQFARIGKKLSFAIEAMDPTGLPVQLTATNLPANAAFDTEQGLFVWTPAASMKGSYEITFTATNAAQQSSTALVSIDVDQGKPVVSSARGLACSSGAIGTVNGKWLLASEGTFAEPSGKSLELGGTRIRINGEAVGLVSAEQTRVSFLCPALTIGQEYRVEVETPAGVSDGVSGVVQSASPEVFTMEEAAADQGVVSFAERNLAVTERNFRISGYPAQPGDEVLIWGTGFGQAAVSVTMNGLEAPVLAVQPVERMAGVYTIRTRIPALAGAESGVPVQVRVYGQDGKLFQSNTITLAVEEAVSR